jgi:lambda repressor-like predicted transcriptional regulator
MSFHDVPTNPAARSKWVIYKLSLIGLSFAEIARKNGWTRKAVSMAMRVPAYPQEKAIAAAIGIPVSRLFPERYTTSGRRLHTIRKTNSTDRAA